MKKYLLPLFIILLFVSCDKDKDADPQLTGIEKDIQGTWSITKITLQRLDASNNVVYEESEPGSDEFDFNGNIVHIKTQSGHVDVGTFIISEAFGANRITLTGSSGDALNFEIASISKSNMVWTESKGTYQLIDPTLPPQPVLKQILKYDFTKK